MIRVVIAGDVRLYREGIEQALRNHPSIQVVATASQHDETIAATRSLRPDIVLLDRSMNNSLALVRDVVACVPETGVILLTVPDNAGEVVACAEAGVVGYVTRDGSIEDLVRAIEAAQRDELCCSPKVAGALLRRVSILASQNPEGNLIAALTPREAVVLEHIEKGLTNKEIANALGVEVATVKNHVHSLLEKLQVERRGEAAALFRRRVRVVAGFSPRPEQLARPNAG